MDPYGAQGQPAERSRPPQQTRPASRLSGGPAATQQGPPVHNHRSHLQSQSRSSRTAQPIERPRSQLSRETSDEPRPSLPSMSTFLQERLERERRAESERASSRASNERPGAMDARDAQSSPLRSGSERRPRSNSGTDPAKKKGLGLKEMEQTLSTLHKQNFDLKLELFHRREKQTELEERLERLEAEKRETDEVNDRLVGELEKRDKAVEEAVAMIVVLEARVELLLREREMVRSVETEVLGLARPLSPKAASTSAPQPTPSTRPVDVPSNNDKVLARMPSFLSERSEHTENLRNVYLDVRGSALSLPQAPDDGPDAEYAGQRRIGSPALSMLSESSFISVYGRRKTSGASSPPSGSSPAAVDGVANSQPSALEHRLARGKSDTPTRAPRPASRLGGVSGQFHAIDDVLGASPLQKLEKLDVTLPPPPRPSTAAPERELSRPSQPRSKKEKREALQRVLVHGYTGREPPMGLPPTPDTISTTTLRHYKNSNDTLSRDREQSPADQRSYLTPSDRTASQSSAVEGHTVGQPASTTAFDSRKHVDGGSITLETLLAISQLQRPRSADETTLSHRRGKNGWDSDYSSDEFADPATSTLSFDPWLRESLKPARPDALGPMSSASQAGPGMDGGRASPDLFSFPSSNDGWAANAMFGSLGGSGYLGAGGRGLSSPVAENFDALGESLAAPIFGSGLLSPVMGPNGAPPPAPNRRSSLHARTSSSSGLLAQANASIPPSPAQPSPGSAKLRKSPMRSSNRTRSNSIDVQPPLHSPRETGMRQERAMTVPPKELFQPPQQPPQLQQPAKQRHYPPTARPRGLNHLFRRSTGSSADVAQPSLASSAPTEPAAKSPTGLMGAPSWGRRGSLVMDDDRSGATPPPILRNKAGSGRADPEEGGVPLEPYGSLSTGDGAPLSAGLSCPGPKPGTSGSGDGGVPLGNANAGAPQRSEGGKRKWLGLGRVGSLRNRGA